MADAVSQTLKSKKIVQEISSDHASTSKFFNHFLYKAGIVVIFFVLLPFFPSQAPEFINQNINARSWELLQLIFVGIAVSYGLFSKKNDGTEKDNNLNIDNEHSYVSKLLQVSSVFDDEAENQTVIDENKVETWNSQYLRGKPVVLVAKQSSGVTEENGSRPGISQKPLLLPVRSLKQRVLDPKEVDLVDDLSGKKGSFNRTSSKRFITNSRKSRNGDFEGSKSENLEGRKEENAVFSSPTSRISRNGNSAGLRSENLEGKMEENVFRSPIPWRSSSGRMEMKESEDDDSESKLLESTSFKSLMPDSSPKKLFPLPSFSSESHAKNGEDVAMKKNFSPPPPAASPPPSLLPKSVSNNSNSSIFIDDKVSSEKVMRRSVRSVPLEKSGESVLEQQSRRTSPGPELRAKSVRTFRTNENLANHVKFPKNENYEFGEKVLIQPTDEESEVETEDDCSEGSSDNEETAVDDIVSDVGPDVDKKADEFIAKFREQIRLQRIDSIRKLTTQHAGAGKA